MTVLTQNIMSKLQKVLYAIHVSAPSGRQRLVGPANPCGLRSSRSFGHLSYRRKPYDKKCNAEAIYKRLKMETECARRGVNVKASDQQLTGKL
jgi:hypothetical protein